MVRKQGNISQGHYCYACRKFFHDKNPNVFKHEKCKLKGLKNFGICIDKKEFGKYYPSNLADRTKEELIKIIIDLKNENR